MADITRTIVINAVTKGFAGIGATLQELGSMVNGVSQELINFGKESVTVYRNYEKSMADAEVALSTKYGRGTRELADAMSQLDAAATEWAATTIFHTNDVGNAISEAAHAGWDLNKIMAGLPAAMQLAQAGGIDLSEAVDYIVKSTNAAGVSFENVGSFIDLWAFAANSSATNIDEMGEAMLRMGSTMRWASDPAELFTLIAATANAGATGSEAGTMIRNSIMRLVAPTDKAKKALADMKATAIETSEVMNDENLFAAYEALVANGFSGVYNEKGEMRSILDIYSEMAVVLGTMSGGVENIANNEQAMSVLSAIFPTRTVTEAINLINAAANGWDGLYDKMVNGEAEGYGEYAATTMMDTLDGKIETFESKVERLKQLVGEELSTQVEQATGFIGNMVDRLAEMDSDQLGALVTGLEVIAAAGPGLMLAGGAFRLIAYMLTPAGGIGLGLIALTSAAAAIKQLEEADFSKNFGNMELDTAGIQTYVQGLGADFKAAYEHVDSFKTALNDSVTAYQEASTTFSATLFQDMLTNTQLTEADKLKLETLGQDMFLAVQGAIASSAAASMGYWNTLFGGEGEAEYDPTYQRIIELTNQAYEEAMAEAEGIGQGLRAAMTAAFEDGTVSDEEYQKILNYMRAYNDAVARAAAEAQSEEDYIKMGKWLHQAQTASLDEIQELAQGAATERDSILADQEDRYLTERFRLEYRGADAETLARTDAMYQRQRQQTESAYDEFLNTLWDSQIQQSGQAENYAFLAGIADQYLNGGLTSDTAMSLIRGRMGQSIYAGESGWGSNTSDRAQLGKIMGFWLDSMGGEEAVASRIGYYEGIGDTASASRLRQLYAMEQLVNGFSLIERTGRASWDLLGLGGTFQTSGQDEYSPLYQNRAAAEAALGISDATYTLDTARKTIETLGTGAGSIAELMRVIGQSANGDWNESPLNYLPTGDANRELGNMYEQLAAMYDMDAVRRSMGISEGNSFGDYFAMWDLLYGAASANPEQFRLPVTPEIQPGATENMPPVTIPIQPKRSGEDSMTSLQEQGVTVEVGADGTELEATIEAEDGQTLLEYLDGDATDLHMTIMAEDGQILTENVTGNAASLAAIINSYNGRTITVNIQGRKLFAQGGRATSASIFGEAGPEWAIPEEHSERTAELLNAAREASGFTWPDLLARFGGMNANPNGGSTTLVYSPTINAQDATGVDEVLRNDKERLDRWYEEKKMRDEVEVYS